MKNISWNQKNLDLTKKTWYVVNRRSIIASSRLRTITQDTNMVPHATNARRKLSILLNITIVQNAKMITAENAEEKEHSDSVVRKRNPLEITPIKISLRKTIPIKTSLKKMTKEKNLPPTSLL